jgi:hypothetical protein
MIPSTAKRILEARVRPTRGIPLLSFVGVRPAVGTIGGAGPSMAEQNAQNHG